MAIYDGFNDAPNQIKSEGQQISVAFIRNGDGTGTIKWSIPSPVAGCSVEDQAYDGIVITVSDKPANYIGSSPKDGTYYEADPTFDPDLHSGDKIDGVRVVGALYHDKTTNSLIVQDVLDKTPYYVSVYAVDNVGRYHREGAHAYSLPTGYKEYNDSTDKPAQHDIGIDTPVLNLTDSTGLTSGTDYTFDIKINGSTHEITIAGSDALTYGNLINAINAQFVLITEADNKDLTALNMYFFDSEKNQVLLWDFNKYITVDVIVDEDDPSTPVSGEFWYDGTNTYKYNAPNWTQLVLFELPFDPANPPCDAIWFDGTDVWQWDNTHWCKLVTYTQTTNPLFPPVMTCDDYWYDTVNQTLNSWSTDINGWEEANAIYSPSDPNTIGVGDLWYDETTELMKIRAAGSVWEDLVNIDYEERNESGELDSPQAGQYWYIPSEQTLFKRTITNTSWVELDFTLAIEDPTVRESCNLWWNSSPSLDDLYIWDELNSTWVLAGSFSQQSIDPSLPPELVNNSAWYNPDDGSIQLLTTVDCEFKDVKYIDFPTDPTNLGADYGWIDGNGVFHVSDGFGGWTVIDPIIAPTDPYVLSTGDLWYDETNDVLNQWDGSAWQPITTLESLVYPELGEIVLNSDDGILYIWNGTTWVETDAVANVKMVNPNEPPNKVNYLCFFTSVGGCEQTIEVIVEAGNLFALLTNNVIYYEPIPGNSRLENGPTYSALGIGDDGSPDERRRIHDIIRRRLGAPSQKVELTADQIDSALDEALSLIRKYSGYGYNRACFFLDLKPNQQKYILTNKCVGFNKITGITYLYRLRSGFLSGNLNSGGYDIYGYAALQHLYKTSTFDMLSFHLVSSFIEDMQILFADNLTFNWIENKRELQLYHTIYDTERVLVDAWIERTEQDLFTNRETREWILRWALAESKMILSQVRGKFQTLPGPNGSTTLNSQELLTQAETEKAELRVELEDPAMQNLSEAGMGAHFILG